MAVAWRHPITHDVCASAAALGCQHPSMRQPPPWLPAILPRPHALACSGNGRSPAAARVPALHPPGRSECSASGDGVGMLRSSALFPGMPGSCV